jgi:hypothetical protein
MTNRAYVNGANFERRIKARLEADGWTVFRTAGSHTPCDLIGVRTEQLYAPTAPCPIFHPVILFVQAKGGQRSMTRKAVAAFRDFALQHGARPLLVERGMNFRWLDDEQAASAAGDDNT